MAKHESRCLRDLDPRILRHLVDRLGDAFILHDVGEGGMPGRIRAVNRRACAMFGYEEDELLALSIPALVKPADRPRIAEFYGRIVAQGEGIVEIDHVTKDGTVLPGEVCCHALELSGRPMGLSVIRDLTRRRHGERMERLSSFALEHAQLAAFWFDPTGRVVYVNDQACRHLGYRRDELLDFHVWDVDPFYPAERLPSFWAALRADGHLRFESEHERKDGSRFPVEISAHYFCFDGQELEFAFARDLTKEREATARLLSSESRYRNLLENLNDVVYSLDTDFTLRYVSPRWAAITGLDPRACLGRSWFDLMYPDDRGRMEGTLRRILDDAVEPAEFRVVGVDERIVWLRSSSNASRTGGKITGIQGILTDVTERKRLEELERTNESDRKRFEERMRDAAKMEAVGRLAGGMAHDFNNVLGAIMGYAELAANALDDPEAVEEALAEIMRAGERGAALSKPLLAFSRRQILEPDVFRLGELIQQVAPMLRRLLGEDVKLVVHSAAVDDRVRADRHQIEQVALNLAVNARDAMPRGGTLSMRTRAVELSQAAADRLGDLAPGAYVILEVADTGSGIDETTRSRIFEPFFTTKSSGKGTGLGLSTVWGIVTQSGGAIRLESELGRGTRFFVYLPRADATRRETARSRPAPGASEEPDARACCTILVAEDEDALRRLVVHVLERDGYEVLSAASPQDAIDQVAEHDGPIDLILSDVVMPIMSGPELVARLHVSHPNAAVLYMSGYPDDAILRHGLSRGEIHFLPKPFKAAELRQKITEVLELEKNG